ncbi:glutaredoxin-like protein NrdH [Streptococcus danieliae]|uniref:Glutaredoxin-like protein NrdH n=1 Tax=Streptococcus danieliae TaxID=747656 RepID=A0A7X3G973_9STRE|nr:glutaredoxin-like protein NrdH [Streptococcus danieliae]MCU0082530.1 glutaredoxin-like protein NrdH [Streptococcus danieliae]MVX59300.1 glutaredoxin-like protein NrdH [Streptococcus danieliae]NYS32727.1 glutaredoxin-like protein NrdH [Streptococcus danieliae]
MVTVYSKNNCMQCRMTKKFLDENRVSYKEINLDLEPEYIETVKEMGFAAAPVIVSPKGNFAGFQPSLLKQLA